MWRVAIGYKQVRQMLAKLWKLEEEEGAKVESMSNSEPGQEPRRQIVLDFIDQFQRDTRNLAKKQLTWFRKLNKATTAWMRTGTGASTAQVAEGIVERLMNADKSRPLMTTGRREFE